MSWKDGFEYRENKFQVVLVFIDWQIASTYRNSLPISVVRTLRGFTQANGKLALILQNYKPEPQPLIYLETMPWFVQFYLHTLQAQVDGQVRGKSWKGIYYGPRCSR
jgi:phosphatidylinositol glycan class T